MRGGAAMTANRRRIKQLFSRVLQPVEVDFLLAVVKFGTVRTADCPKVATALLRRGWIERDKHFVRLSKRDSTTTRRGRRMKNTTTPSHPKKKQPFIVREIDSRMLRKNPDLSKGARMLWGTMLSMADAKTGELRHRDHWYSGIEIDMRAELSHVTRKLLMQELALAGYVHWERDRIKRVLKDRLTGHLRMRCVSGRTKYFVSKSPRKHWGPSKVHFSRPLDSRNTPNKTEGQNEKSPHKQRPSSKVKSLYRTRILPASLSVTHHEAGVRVSSDSPQGQISHSPSSSVSGTAQAEKTDDDLSDIPSRFEVLLEKAKNILVSKGHELDYVEVALDWIDERSFQLGKSPGSVAYYLKCFETLEESLTEKDLVWEHVKKRRALYAKFGMPVDVTNLQLTPKQEKARQSFNRRHTSVRKNEASCERVGRQIIAPASASWKQ